MIHYEQTNDSSRQIDRGGLENPLELSLSAKITPISPRWVNQGMSTKRLRLDWQSLGVNYSTMK